MSGYSWVSGRGPASRTLFYQDATGRDIAYIREISSDGFKYRANIRATGIWQTEQSWVTLDQAKKSVSKAALEMRERDLAAIARFREELKS